MIDEERHPVDILADEFAQRLRQGEQPSIEEYADRYPDHAALIRSVFPSVAAVERIAQQDSTSPIPARGNSPSAHQSYGDFEIVRRIGEGGMGVVYEAIQRSLRRRVALKVMNDSSSAKEGHRLRFRREAEAAAGLHHTNIVPIFGIGEDHGLQYYAMQLIEGSTLQQIIECLRTTWDSQQGTFSGEEAPALQAARQLMQSSSENASLHFESEPTDAKSTQTPKTKLAQASTASNGSDRESMTLALGKFEIATDSSRRTDTNREFSPSRFYHRNVARIIASTANALDYAHHAGVLHRDIKPANLLLDREGTVWIADFGLARREDIEGQTQTGELLGTLQYMAPEQIRGIGDQRMDIYSLGLTLYEMLTLQYGLESPRARLIDPLGHSQVRFTKAMQRLVPRDLQTIVLKACALAPEDRYQRAADMEQDLRRFLEDRPIRARRASPLEQLNRWARRNPMLAMLTALSFSLLLTIAGLLALWNRQQQGTLSRLAQEYDRAESNLQQKTQALNRAESEQARAEKNLRMAIEAFDQIMSNIAARGRLITAPELVEEESQEFVDAYLTQADVELLQSLASFFDRFAEQNTTDLRIETAVARRRVGEIQHRVGKLDDAANSLNQAIIDFESVRKASLNSKQAVLEEVAAREELILILGKRGQLPRANSLFTETRQLIASFPEIASSTEGRFALAKLLGNMVNVGPRFATDRRRRPTFASPNRTPPQVATPPSQQARLKRESELNSEALGILESLAHEDANQPAFQLAFARAYKDQVRIRIALGDHPGAEASLRKAIAIMESLLKTNPASASYRHDLADILSINIAFRDEDSARTVQALELCESLVTEHPNAPQYLVLKASVLSRLASIGAPQENRGDKAIARLSEAIEIQSDLARRFPDVPLYWFALVQYHLQQSEIYFAMRRPEKARESINTAANIAEKMQNNGVNQPLLKSFLDRIRERKANLEDKKSE